MGQIPATTYISIAASATTQGGAIPLGYDELDGCSFSLEFGDVTGSWLFEATNDPRAMQNHPDESNADWDDITSDIGATDPAGSAGDETVILDNTRFAFIRLKYTHSAGTEHVRVHFSGHGSGR